MERKVPDQELSSSSLPSASVPCRLRIESGTMGSDWLRLRDLRLILGVQLRGAKAKLTCPWPKRDALNVFTETSYKPISTISSESLIRGLWAGLGIGLEAMPGMLGSRVKRLTRKVLGDDTFTSTSLSLLVFCP